jgi:hypothetical protein
MQGSPKAERRSTSADTLSLAGIYARLYVLHVLINAYHVLRSNNHISRTSQAPLDDLLLNWVHYELLSEDILQADGREPVTAVSVKHGKQRRLRRHCMDPNTALLRFEYAGHTLEVNCFVTTWHGKFASPSWSTEGAVCQEYI